MGNLYISVKALLDDLGIDYVIPPFNNKRALELGNRHAPEMACLPLKINIGNYLQALESGADTVLMAGGHGPCRFGYYCEIERGILEDAGRAMDFITLEVPDEGIGELIRRVRKLTTGANLFKIVRAAAAAAKIVFMVDELEKLSFHTRPREVDRGCTDRIYRRFLSKVLSVKGSRDIKKLIEKTRGELVNIKIDKNFMPLKVGIVGEIYTTIDQYASFEIQSKLGNMGVEIDRKVTIGQWLMEHILKNLLPIPKDLRYAEAAKPYLKTMIGGHAMETVGNAVLYGRRDYDGVIQIYPLSCMPEIVAQSLLPSVERDCGIPVLTLIVDEMTGEAGYMTRLEAFVDLLLRRRGKRAIGALSWD